MNRKHKLFNKRDFVSLVKFCRQLEDFSSSYTFHRLSIEEQEIIAKIYHYLSNRLLDCDEYFYDYDMLDDYKPWHEDDEFDQLLDFFYRKFSIEHEDPIPEPVKYLSYEYDYDNRTVKLKFSNGAIVTMNDIEFFTIESKISAMKYDVVIKEYAIEVIENAS